MHDFVAKCTAGEKGRKEPGYLSPRYSFPRGGRYTSSIWHGRVPLGGRCSCEPCSGCAFGTSTYAYCLAGCLCQGAGNYYAITVASLEDFMVCSDEHYHDGFVACCCSFDYTLSY